MAIEGFRAGWRAGVQDANSTMRAAVRDVRGGNVQGAVQTAGARVGDLRDGGLNLLRRVGEGMANFAGNVADAFGAGNLAAEARGAANELRGARHEGQAQSSLRKAGSSFKKAWTAAFRASKNGNIKGLGANLAFSVSSWGGNMKEGMKNLGCAIRDGFKALGSWFKTQI